MYMLYFIYTFERISSKGVFGRGARRITVVCHEIPEDVLEVHGRAGGQES